jgi:hypothetical protein
MDFKDKMFEGIERGWWSEEEAYDSCRDLYLAYESCADRFERGEAKLEDEGPKGIAAFKSMRYS